MSNYHLNGIYNIYAAAIRLAIKDYREIYRKIKPILKNRNILSKKVSASKRQDATSLSQLNRINNILYDYSSAEFFLFSKDGLERLIEESGLPLSIDYIRKMALKKKLVLDDSSLHKQTY